MIWPAFHMVIESTSEYLSSRKFASQRIYPFLFLDEYEFLFVLEEERSRLDRLSEWSLREFP
mgnify:FL=1